MKSETIARFWAKVFKTDGCWIWKASKRHKGYGAFVWADDEGKVVQGRAHRFSWLIHFGPIPDGLCVLHTCDNTACVRPEHLFLGTKADNNTDMRNKGRNVPGNTYGNCKYERGEKHHAARLNEATIRAIRKDREAGMSFGQLAKKYMIGVSHAFRIATKKAWIHVK